MTESAKMARANVEAAAASVRARLRGWRLWCVGGHSYTSRRQDARAWSTVDCGAETAQPHDTAVGAAPAPSCSCQCPVPTPRNSALQSGAAAGVGGGSRDSGGGGRSHRGRPRQRPDAQR
ncbi:hypothetical protein BS78_10G136300 [Paspalum vaginatum]|nr:hypothetical protein BS78_10G136300 [Paspalum vaginatum]